MLKIKETKKIQRATEILNCFNKVNQNYWIDPVKKFFNLSKSETGYVIYNYLR